MAGSKREEPVHKITQTRILGALDTKPMKKYDDDEKLHKFLEDIPERFILTAEELDREVYDKFLESAQKLDPPYDYPTLIKQSQELFHPSITISQKQQLLTQLAQCDTVEAYRLIERYHERPDPALDQWSKIALYECRMRLEHDLLDDNIGLISTGLGGEGQRLRYLVILGFRQTCSPKSQHTRLQGIWQYVCQQHDSALESLQYSPSYLMAQILVSMGVAVGTVIEESIFLINQEGKQVYQEYMVTNVGKPTDEEIQTFLNDVAEE